MNCKLMISCIEFSIVILYNIVTFCPLHFRVALYVTDRHAKLGIAVIVTLAVTLGIALIIIRVYIQTPIFSR